MNILIVVLIGAVLGALAAAGIYFEPREPYKPQIVAAGTIRGTLVAVLTGLSMSPESGITGALSGLLIAWLAF